MTNSCTEKMTSRRGWSMRAWIETALEDSVIDVIAIIDDDIATAVHEYQEKLNKGLGIEVRRQESEP